MTRAVSTRLSTLTLAVIAVLLAACGRVTARGTVLEDPSGQPIAEAMVVAVWNGKMTNTSGCYHVEATRTRADGSFEINAVVPSAERTGVHDFSPDYPGIVVYKASYHQPLARARELMSWANSLSEASERMPIPKGRARYLVSSTLDEHEHARYLGFLGAATTCWVAKASWKNAVPLLVAVRAEAQALATTDYAQYIVETLNFFIASASTGGTSPPRFPTPQFDSVIMAVRSRDPRRLPRALAKPGADVEHRDRDDHTPLMVAAFNGSVEMVEMLLAAGADPGKVTSDHEATALHRAIAGASTFGREPATAARYVDIVRVLVNSPGTDVDARDALGKTALDYEPPPRIAELLRARAPSHQSPGPR